MEKRALSMLLVLCMVWSLVPTTVLAAESNEVEQEALTGGTFLADGDSNNPTILSDSTVTYAVTGGNLYFETATGTITDCDITVTAADIPTSISGVVVTSIGDEAFSFCRNLTSIVIPGNVTDIGANAFFSCSSLTRVTIPDSVISIGNNAFYDCSLTSVVIPNSVTTIGTGAFYGNNLTSVTIPNSITTIGNHTFGFCQRLVSVTIPSSVTSIGERAFTNCSSLTSVTLPSSVTAIGERTFDGCSRLTSATILGDIPSIEDGTFAGCSSLKEITIPKSVISIGEFAFLDCDSLSSVTIPDNVTSIGGDAFAKCDRLTNIYFLGNAPSVSAAETNSPSFEKNIILYYIIGKTGWTTPTWNGYKTLPKEGGPSDLQFDHTAITLEKGKTFQLHVNGADGASVIALRSSNSAIASIDDRGIVTANGFGTATIQAIADIDGVEKIANCAVTVPGVVFEKPQSFLLSGESYTLKYTEYPTGTQIIWNSSDETVATVNRDTGLITPHTGGRTIISASVNIQGTDGNWMTQLCGHEVFVCDAYLEQTELMIEPGSKEVLNLHVNYLPDGYKVQTQSSDSKVATVNGMEVTAIDTGIAIVTVDVMLDNVNVSSYTCKVYVVDEDILVPAENLIKTHGKLLYQPYIEGEKYYLYQSERINYDENDGLDFVNGSITFYLLDENYQIVVDPEILMKAGFLQQFNGPGGFKNSSMYRDELSTEQLIKEYQELRGIYNTNGLDRGSLAGLINVYELKHILEETHHVISQMYGIANAASLLGDADSWWEYLEQLTGVFRDVDGLMEDIDKFESDIPTVEYLYVQASSGILTLQDAIKPAKGRIWSIIDRFEKEDSPFLTNYYSAVEIEKYSLLKEQNQQLHPLTLKYLKDGHNWSLIDYPILDLITLVPWDDINKYESSLNSWMGPLPNMRNEIQEKMWFRKTDGPDGKALLALDKSKITDSDFLQTLQNITALQEDYSRKIYPSAGTNPIGNAALVRTIVGEYPHFDQVVSVHCPVDVEVYNETGELIGAVRDNTIDSTYAYDENNPLLLFVEGEEKVLVFPYENNYRVDITAVDNGIMQYFEWRESEHGDTLSETNIQEILLTYGDEYQVNQTQNISNPNYSLLTTNDSAANVKIDVSSPMNGQTVGGGCYVEDTNVSVQAIPNDGFVFEGWYENGLKVDKADAIYTFTADRNRVLEARFVPFLADVSYSAVQMGGEQGTADSLGISIIFSQPITGLLANDIIISGDVDVSKDGIITVDGQTWIIPLSNIKTAGTFDLSIADFGTYHFTTTHQTVEIYKNDVVLSDPEDSSDGENTQTSYVIISEKPAHGTLQIHPTRASEGDTVTITTAPDDGYELDKLTVKGSNGNELKLTEKGNGEFTFTMPASHVEVSVTFKKVVEVLSDPEDSSDGENTQTSYVIISEKPAHGTLQIRSTRASEGDTVTIITAPDDGYELDKLTVKDSNGNELKLTEKGNGKFTFTMPASHVEVSVTFKNVVEVSSDPGDSSGGENTASVVSFTALMCGIVLAYLVGKIHKKARKGSGER